MADVTSQHLHRKPVHSATSRFSQTYPSPPRIQTTALSPTTSSNPPPQQTSSHSHSRTVSSNIFPTPVPQYSQTTTTTTTQNYSRRTPSSATMSTMSSKGADPVRSPSSVSVTLRRSVSTRSGTSFVPTSYVALMRKQKATVWCDRAQLEDPRMAAAAKAAKHRAALEVAGSKTARLGTSTSATSSGSGVRSKITNRYNAPVKPVGYSANLLGTTGVPMRLSATEVGDEDQEEADTHSDFRGQRTGSGRSSLQNSSRLSTVLNPRQSGRLSTSSTPPSAQSVSPIGSTPVSASTTMVSKRRTTGDDYFQQPPGNGGSGGSSGEEARFGDVGDMEAPKTQKEGKTADDLARRGSVDERASTMRGAVRLFVANPDLSD